MFSWDQIFSIMQVRRERNGPILDQMIAVRDRYNGDWVLPDISAEQAPELPPLTPALIAESIDNYGMRASSVVPAIRCPAIDPSKQSGKRSMEYATVRRRIITSTYSRSRMQLQLRKAYRHLTGYATCCLVVIPDFVSGMPVIRVRDPLTAYPDPKAGEDFTEPENVGFIFAKSADWIRRNYPAASGVIPRTTRGEEMWDMVEWIDRDHIVIGMLGPRETQFYNYVAEPLRWSTELARFPNRVGRCTAVIPARVTLDRIASQLTHVIGITDLSARLMALDIMAKEKSIFPDRYILGRSGLTPQLVGGNWKDGRSGEMNIVLDAEAVGSVAFAADPASTQAIDRLERNARVSSGLVPQFGGETYGALRTGRGIDALMGAAVDPRIQEMQEVMQTWLAVVNEIVFEMYREFWPDKKYTVVSDWPTDYRQVEFTPSVHIETIANAVSYPIAGADVQGTNIILGQLVGSDMISRKSAMERHPWIGDAAEEKARIDEETFERAATQSMLQQAVTGQIPLVVLAEIEKARRSNPTGDIFTAIDQANRRMQEMQAQQPPEPPEGMAAPPEAMPGLAAGPQPQTQPELAAPPGAQPGATVGAPPNLAGLRTLMNALSQTSRRG
jgi:hypothetical protein